MSRGGGTDVNFRFDADLQDIRHELEDMNQYVQGWGLQIKDVLVEPFRDLFAAIVELPFELLNRGFEGFTDAVREGIAAAAEAEQINARLGIAIRGVREGFVYSQASLEAWASQLERTSGFSDEALKKTETLLIGFHLAGETFKRTTTVAIDMASALGGDVTSSAQKLGQAMQSLEKGMPQRALRSLRQELSNLTKEETDHITELSKMGRGQEAVGLVLDEISRKYKGASDTLGNTFIGQMSRLNNIVDDVRRSLGRTLLPTLEALVPVFEKIGHHVQGLADKLADMGKAFAESKTGKTGVEAIKGYIEQLYFYIEEFFKRIPANFDRIMARFHAMIAGIKVEVNEFIAGLPSWYTGQAGVDAKKALGPKVTEETMTDEQKTKFKEMEKNSQGWYIAQDYNPETTNAEAKKNMADAEERQTEARRKVMAMALTGAGPNMEFTSEQKAARAELERANRDLAAVKENVAKSDAAWKQTAAENMSKWDEAQKKYVDSIRTGPAYQALRAAEDQVKAADDVYAKFDPYGVAVKKDIAAMNKEDASKAGEGILAFIMSIEESADAARKFPTRAKDQIKSVWDNLASGFQEGHDDMLDKGKKLSDKEKEARAEASNSRGFWGEFMHGVTKGIGEKQGQSELDTKMKALQGIVDEETKPAKPFKSAIEDAQSVFKRVQTSAASDREKEEIPKKQLTKLGEIAQHQLDALKNAEKEAEFKKRLDESMKKLADDGVSARAGK